MKRFFTSAFIAILIGLAAWATLINLRPERISIPASNQQPDAFMEEIVSAVMNKEGQLKLKLFTPKMIHYPENDQTKLLDPSLIIYHPGSPPWQVRARFARAEQGMVKVIFWNDVRIQQTGDKKKAATLIKTDELVIYPQKNTAETDRFITLQQANLLIKATGLFADLNTGEIQLKSKARGEYVPQP